MSTGEVRGSGHGVVCGLGWLVCFFVLNDSLQRSGWKLSRTWAMRAGLGLCVKMFINHVNACLLPSPEPANDSKFRCLNHNVTEDGR